MEANLDFTDLVIERDIDRLLMEELECNAAFREWFLGLVGMWDAAKGKFLTIGYSVTDNELGESDLVLCVEIDRQGIHATLIENKIDAPLQPGQGARYRRRGERGLKIGLWTQFTTCLVAPARYPKSTESEIFDRYISYEEIVHWFGQQPSDRLRMAYQSTSIRISMSRPRWFRLHCVQPPNLPHGTPSTAPYFEHARLR